MAVREYIGARYVPKFDGVHTSEKAYEPLTIVTDINETTSYTSKKHVPVGISLNNLEYWAVSGTLSGALLELQNRMSVAEADIDDIEDAVGLGDEPRFLVVSKEGGRFTTINAAIDYARGYATQYNRVVIFIMPGVYEEYIRLIPNFGVDFIGSGVDVTTIRSNVAYPDAPMHILGTTYVANLTLDSTNSYAMHLDEQDSSGATRTGGSVRFVNCKFKSNANHAVGIGMGNGLSMFFDSCDFECYSNNTTHRPLLIHNDPYMAGQEFAYFRGCRFTHFNGGQTCIWVANSRSQYSPDVEWRSNMYLSFENCNARLPRISYTTGSEQLSYVPTSGEVQLLDSSCGNNIVGVSYDKNVYKYCGMNSTTADSKLYIPIDAVLVNDYDFTLNMVQDFFGLGDITSNCELAVNSNLRCLVITNTNSNTPKTPLFVQFTATPK